jgi:aryl-alcohol dehydrogenase-like predicted oxidoreductase
MSPPSSPPAKLVPLSALEAAYLAPRAPGAPVRLALGTMNFGKRTNEVESARILDRAVERGVTLFDTANVYTDGASEQIVGKAAKRHQGRVLVATKVGFGRTAGKQEGLSRAAVTSAVEGSLRRLGLDHVDLYYLHTTDPKTPVEETVDAMAGLRRKGHIRHFAVSNHASWQILEVDRLCDEHHVPRPRVSQVMYNLLVRQVEIEYLRFTQRYPIHTTVYNPVAGGLLTGRYHPGATAEKGSRFDNNPLYQRRYFSPRLLDLAASYQSFAEAHGMSLLELAYAWLAGSPGVDSILVGPGSVAHLDAAIDACDKQVPPDARARVDEIYRGYLGTDATYAR